MCKEGEENGYFATDTQGTTYVNEVWPGDANYPDFGRRKVRDWWGKHHKFLVDIGVDGVWNDMNELASCRRMLYFMMRSVRQIMRKCTMYMDII